MAFPPLKALDADGRVRYLGTFSKAMFPAIRLGYLVLPPALVDVFARAKFERHVRRARARNGARRAALLDALQSHCGDAGVYSVTPHYLEPPREAGLVLGYAGLMPKEIRAGVAALARALA